MLTGSSEPECWWSTRLKVYNYKRVKLFGLQKISIQAVNTHDSDIDETLMSKVYYGGIDQYITSILMSVIWRYYQIADITVQIALLIDFYLLIYLSAFHSVGRMFSVTNVSEIEHVCSIYRSGHLMAALTCSHFKSRAHQGRGNWTRVLWP